MLRSQLILLDIFDNALFLDRSLMSAQYPKIPLKLSLLEPVSNDVGHRLDIKQAMKILGRVQNRPDWKQSKVLVGIESDPLQPFTKKFNCIMRCLEEVAASPPAELIIQTRSPLIVLALPLLKRLKERLSVVMAVEAINDSIHQRFTPQLPRPSERMAAARTLTRFGINTRLQIAPMLGNRNSLKDLPRKALSTFINECDTAALSVEVLKIAEIVDEGLSPQFLLQRFGGELQKISHIILSDLFRTELKAARLIRSIPDPTGLAA